MNIRLANIAVEDFAFVQGVSVKEQDLSADNSLLLSQEHNAVDNCHVPFWATAIQDIIENKAVTYSEREVEEEEFLGLRIISESEEIRVSVGLVGFEHSIVQVVIPKIVDESTGETTLGAVARLEWSLQNQVTA